MMLARLLLTLGLVTVFPVQAQDFNTINSCATGCCSKSGYCGVGDGYCGADCVASSDFQAECDANHPCANDACCSKAGLCGLGPYYCSPESCVSGCDNRAYCDPGGYGDYVEHLKCLLNVCYSKHGYTGITEEFCGNKKVTKPLANFNGYTPLNRIVGYYEGWSRKRNCHTFFPEQIPLGMYTHLNYAFATIDPETFEVKLASSGEENLVRCLARLKTQDPYLKVSIAIGGWAYNDPGPTQTTFSDLAASQDAQKKFFESLISFLSTYSLDGVDIDWRYPCPDDIVKRNGREEDFKNFPAFLQHLKQALKTAGGRDGLTITLSASYWFLQYFDIVKLEKYVDFFNILTYDLHGAGDLRNTSLDPYLNAHKNLTEIQDAMDLVWCNKIPSNKVILGNGFYGRPFPATSASCMEPGCTYESAASKGLCSNENGILPNSKIVDIIEGKGPTPKLYKEAAVNVLHTLCCLGNSMPTCAWYTNTNSFFDYHCPNSMVDVGNMQGGYHRGYQAAGCSLKQNGEVRHNMGLWGQCLWASEHTNCRDICLPRYIFPQLSSTSGSGTVECSMPSRKYYFQEENGNQCGNGKWSWLGPDLFAQDVTKSDECISDCDRSDHRLAMQQSGPCQDKSGAMSFCAPNLHCNFEWKGRQNVTDLKNALHHFFESPTCPNPSEILAARATTDCKAQDIANNMFLYLLQEMYRNNDTLANYTKCWNEAIEEFYPNLLFPRLRDKLAETYENIFALDLQQFADNFLCYLNSFNDFFGEKPALTCGISNPCDGEDSDCDNDEWDDPCLLKTFSLKNPAARRSYCVTWPNGQGADRETAVRSSTYDTSGELATNSPVRDRAVVFRNFADCGDSEVIIVTIRTGNTFNGRMVHNEHETELNTEPRFLSDIAHGRLDENTLNAYAPIPAGRAPGGLPVGGAEGDNTNLQLQIPSVRIYEAYGSRRNTVNFFLLDAYLNFLKNRCWMWRRWNRGPLADSSMQRYINNIMHPDQALWRLRSVISVYRYLNAEEVRRGLRAQYRDIGNERWTINQAWNIQHPAQAFDIRPFWPPWYRNHIQGMIRTSTAFMNRWLDAMDTQWRGRTGQLADRVNEDIARLRRQVDNGAIDIRIDDF